MKNSNMIMKTALVFLAGTLATTFSLKAQNGHDKDIHTDKRTITRNGKDSIVTIVKEDRSNGLDVKRTIVIRDGDTVTNIATSESNGSGIENGSSVIINGDSIVKIYGAGGNKNTNAEKKT